MTVLIQHPAWHWPPVQRILAVCSGPAYGNWTSQNCQPYSRPLAMHSSWLPFERRRYGYEAGPVHYRQVARQVLLQLGLVTPDELTAAIATEFNPTRISFHGGTEMWLRDVLNLGVAPRCCPLLVPYNPNPIPSGNHVTLIESIVFLPAITSAGAGTATQCWQNAAAAAGSALCQSLHVGVSLLALGGNPLRTLHMQGANACPLLKQEVW